MLKANQQTSDTAKADNFRVHFGTDTQPGAIEHGLASVGPEAAAEMCTPIEEKTIDDLKFAECLPRPDVSAGSSRFLAMLAQLARMTRVSLWVEHDETTGDTPLAPSRVAVRSR